ncbi:MAG: hypothetical protein M0Z38_02340 [Deltaproteobacteria bacterium]|nr:hypothetical protein [Deltaproteobacteria bacterium]
MSLPEMKEQVRIIGELLKHIMIKDVHYGTIPGTQKPTLYKPGSEKILSTFRIAADPREMITDLSTDDEVRYRVGVAGTAQLTGVFLGAGIGECSSDEEKYKWRKPVCNEEFDEAPIDRRREVWKRYDGKPVKIKQIRTHPRDVANTVLKMAKKRAQIDMTLTVTAASDVFDQDLEDMSPEIREGITGEKKESMKPPQEKKPEGQEGQSSGGDSEPIITQGQGKMLFAKFKGKGVKDGDAMNFNIRLWFGIPTLELFKLPKRLFEDCNKKIDGMPAMREPGEDDDTNAV